jgi:hypothetical protein
MGITSQWLRNRALHRASVRSKGWLVSHAASFTIGSNTGTLTIKGNPVPWRVKPLIELMLFIVIVKRNNVQSKASLPLTDLVLSEAATFDWHELAAFDPAAISPLALTLQFFELHGRDHPFEIDYFETLQSTEYLYGMDRLPYRDMDLQYALSKAGRPESAEKLPGLFQDTAFGRGQLVPRYSVDDIYSLTHALFYLTDLGQQSLDAVLDPPTRLRLRRDLVVLTVAMVRGDNCDVLGELLICWIMCGFEAGPAEQAILGAGLDRMLVRMTADGAVPPTSDVRRRLLNGEAGFADVYHTTLVAAILFALLGKSR